MNELIKQLAEQANPDFAKFYIVGPWHAEDLEKFAELIVRECCEVINNDCNLQFSEGVITNLGGLNQARELIKQHFGVEE